MPPYSTSGSAVDECIRFYDVQCLHGLAVADPGADAVNACVSSIQTSPCDAGLPLFETASACDWLTELPTVEASIEASETDAADAADAASDTSDDSPEAESL
jgi:hypothetical protein